MILGHIHSYQSTLPSAIQMAIKTFIDEGIDSYQPGRYEIKGEEIFVNIMSFETQSAQTKFAEVHKDYIDVQILISGSEVIYYGLEDKTHQIEKEYDVENDFYLVKNILNEQQLIMTPFMFAVFLPEQPHKPGCLLDNSTSIKKAVIKIHKKLL